MHVLAFGGGGGGSKRGNLLTLVVYCVRGFKGVFCIQRGGAMD